MKYIRNTIPQTDITGDYLDQTIIQNGEGGEIMFQTPIPSGPVLDSSGKEVLKYDSVRNEVYTDHYLNLGSSEFNGAFHATWPQYFPSSPKSSELRNALNQEGDYLWTKILNDIKSFDYYSEYIIGGTEDFNELIRLIDRSIPGERKLVVWGPSGLSLKTLDLSKVKGKNYESIIEEGGLPNKLILGDGIKLGRRFRLTSDGRDAFRCSTISGLERLDITPVEDLYSVFRTESFSNLKTLDNVKDWNTSACTDLSLAFLGQTLLESIDISRWSTRNVRNFQNMFTGCKSLGLGSSVPIEGGDYYYGDGDIEITKFGHSGIKGIEFLDTKEAVNLKSMFLGCINIQSLDLSRWNTRKVEDMDSIFSGCKNLLSLNISGWKIPSAMTDISITGESGLMPEVHPIILNMSGLWSDYPDLLRKVVLGLFKTKVLSRIQELDLSGVDLSQAPLNSIAESYYPYEDRSEVTDFFQSNSSPVYTKTLRVMKLPARGFCLLDRLFKDCTKLQGVVIPQSLASDVTSMVQTFNGCALTSYDFLPRSFPRVESLPGTFMNTHASKIILPEMINLRYMENTFDGSDLEEIEISGLPALYSMSRTFNNCKKLKKVVIKGCPNISYMDSTFLGCTALDEIRFESPISYFQDEYDSSQLTFVNTFGGSSVTKIHFCKKFFTKTYNVTYDLSSASSLDPFYFGENLATMGDVHSTAVGNPIGGNYPVRIKVTSSIYNWLNNHVPIEEWIDRRLDDEKCWSKEPNSTYLDILYDRGFRFTT